MRRFNGMKRKAAKALQAFADAKVKLEKVTLELQKMIEGSKKEQDRLAAAHAEETQAIMHAESQISQHRETIRKIGDLIGH